jgi:uncharacterized lipoprotein YehR (DUF1307 family)
MKKIGRIISLVVVGLFLVSCGKSAEETTTYENNAITGVKATLTYYHKGDKVIRQTSKNIINYEETGLENKDAAEEAMKSVGIDMYKDIEGIEHSIKYEVPGIDVSGDTKKGVSLKASEKLLEANGYTKINK